MAQEAPGPTSPRGEKKTGGVIANINCFLYRTHVRKMSDCRQQTINKTTRDAHLARTAVPCQSPCLPVGGYPRLSSTSHPKQGVFAPALHDVPAGWTDHGGEDRHGALPCLARIRTRPGDDVAALIHRLFRKVSRKPGSSARCCSGATPAMLHQSNRFPSIRAIPSLIPFCPDMGPAATVSCPDFRFPRAVSRAHAN